MADRLFDLRKKNHFIPIVKYFEVLKENLLYTFPPQPFGDGVNTMFGKRVIAKDCGVVLFDECEYCRGTEIKKGLNELWICCSCGAAI